MPRQTRVTDPHKMPKVRPGEVTTLRLHPNILKMHRGVSMRRMEIVKVVDGVITEVTVHNQPVR